MKLFNTLSTLFLAGVVIYAVYLLFTGYLM